MPPRFVVYKAPVTLTFKEVVTVVSERTGIRKDDIRTILDEFFYLVFEALRRGHNIKLANVGCWNVVRTYPRVVWDAAGKLQFIPSIHQVGFRVARSARQKMFDFFTRGLDPTPRVSYADEVSLYHLKYALSVAERRLERRMKLDVDDLNFLRGIIEDLKEKDENKTAPSEDEADDLYGDEEDQDDNSEEYGTEEDL